MNKNFTFLSIIVILISGCSKSGEVAMLRKENELLKTQLNDPSFMRVTFVDVNKMIDDIDAGRNAAFANRNSITSIDGFKTRLSDINAYVQQAELKLRALEKQLAGLRNETSAYTMMVYALKGEVSIRDEDVVALSSTLKEFQQQNINLLDSVKLQESRAAGLFTDIEEKQRKLSVLESRMLNMETDFRKTEAEVYYAKGQLLEESARKVRLAPQKRKQSYAEALELYRKALTLGKKEAEKNIAALEETLGYERQTHVATSGAERKW